ncbi:hypothetical protein ABB37_00498 [Leptomonas pyrrhocoris]|uniref:Secreted protein n=1 Tax=Leptomonas pyrrhocoris TaxID=157538 RepID=A0A0M9GAH6_LEPPY|nr:hypothetical protein ABB37_00498 [Leptomonas pyrrhocoris]KPA86270.1 hypothetical protein ABB37_00498 [Leptomonas pyrrhocoris]|eukprot:XP_015664709.1 hypothetical protein ABB37_00498 [Leptomonas pyrrhocoris]
MNRKLHVALLSLSLSLLSSRPLSRKGCFLFFSHRPAPFPTPRGGNADDLSLQETPFRKVLIGSKINIKRK